MFYRLISGMHTSISAHLSYDYLLDEVGQGCCQACCQGCCQGCLPD